VTETDPDPIIDVEQLSYEYPGLRALDDVSFHVRRGSITALVGPNGAGKTTLMRCLAGIDRPLTGTIRVNGVDVVEEPRRSHHEIGYLSDFFGLYRDLDVRHCLSYVAAANDIAPAEIAPAVERAAAALGFGDRLDQRAGNLSRGLRQRVAIAQAIIHEPRVVLLDEPASGLDPEARYHLGELFVALGRRGMTLLVSSHILAELEAYSTDMLVLREGRLLEHRRLGHDSDQASLLALEVTTPLDAALAVLDADPRISTVVPEQDGVRFHFTGDASARAALLAELVGKGVGVAQLAVVSEDLQQSYLRSISGGETAGEP
jgi:ABC-2 type transport system ATP-binding protein